MLANGSLSSNQSGEGEIRKNIVLADLVDCIVTLPGQLFYNTQIPVSLWFLARDKRNHSFRDRRGETLFIDARQLGHMVDRTHRDLSADDFEKISGTYHAWRGDPKAGGYRDVQGFCKAAATAEIGAYNFVLTPGRYTGSSISETPSEDAHARIADLVALWRHQATCAKGLEDRISRNLQELGYGE